MKTSPKKTSKVKLSYGAADTRSADHIALVEGVAGYSVKDDVTGLGDFETHARVGFRLPASAITYTTGRVNQWDTIYTWLSLC